MSNKRSQQSFQNPSPQIYHKENLGELQIDFDQYEHPVVLTVEEQAKCVGHLNSALSKNLFLKDKKSRFYIVYALAETKVDLKILSQRLGLGKGGLRMAPEEALAEILQECFITVRPRVKTQEHCFFHPLSNDMSISLNTRDLYKFLNSIGKQPVYVDLEDQPPDLASIVPSNVPILPDNLDKRAPSVAPEKKHVPANINSKAVTGEAVKVSNGPKKNPTSAPDVSASLIDPEKFVDEILEKTSLVVLSEIKSEATKQHVDELGYVVSNSIRRQLTTKFKNIATIFRNTAYTEGFQAGIHHQLKRI